MATYTNLFRFIKPAPDENYDINIFNDNFDKVDSLIYGRVAKNTPISGGTFPKITFDSKGLVKSGTNLNYEDVPAEIQACITPAATSAEYLYYNLDSDGNAVDLQFNSVGKTSVVNLVLPLVIDGHLVKHIAQDGFVSNVLETAIIPDNPAGIGTISLAGGVFQRSPKLKSVYIGNVVSGTGNWNFNECPALTNIYLSNGIKSIGEGSFVGCSGLSTITIPDSVTLIGNKAFYGCSGLKTINLSRSLKNMGERVFQGCTSLKYLAFPDTLNSVGSNLLEGCSSLCDIDLGHGLQSVGVAMFSDCFALQEINIPDNITKLDRWCFCRCINLKKLYIPKSVISIGENLFEDITDVKIAVYVYKYTTAYYWAKKHGYVYILLDEQAETVTQNAAYAGNIPLFGTVFADVEADGAPVIREDGSGEYLLHITSQGIPMLRYMGHAITDTITGISYLLTIRNGDIFLQQK